MAGGKDGGTIVWDLPTRLFHWALALCVIAAWFVGEFGLASLSVHMMIGEVVLALLLFRVAWGFVGGRHARFADFVRGPAAILAYLRGGPPGTPGHNPLGALSVLALIAVLLVQAGSGLFADDDIATTGPLAGWVSSGARATLTTVHKVASKVVVTLVLLHVVAIAFYRFVKRQRLVEAMVTGRRTDVSPQAGPGAAVEGGLARAAIVFAACAAAVAILVRLG